MTVYGTIGVEYAAKNIPVINASLNNPHINYSFNINPKTKLDYENKLLNLKNIKKKFNNNDIYEYYYMKNIFSEKSIFIKDYHKLVNQLGGGTDGYKAMNTSKVYNFILDEFKNKKLINKKRMIINFINTREYKLGFKIYEI